MTDKSNNKSDEVDHTLGLDQPESSRVCLKTGVVLVFVLITLTVGYNFLSSNKKADIQFKTSPVQPLLHHWWEYRLFSTR